jgi:hypothetical protein
MGLKLKYIKDNTMEAKKENDVEALKSSKKTRRRQVIQQIISTVDEEMGLDLRNSKKSRVREIVNGRAIVYIILRKHLKMSYTDISKVFNKNHATIIHSVKQLPHILKYDSDLAYSYQNITYRWLGDVDNYVRISDVELKTRIKDLINENKMLNLRVTKLQLDNYDYSEKYKKYLLLVKEWDYRVGNKFEEFKRKVNSILNGM